MKVFFDTTVEPAGLRRGRPVSLTVTLVGPTNSETSSRLMHRTSLAGEEVVA